MNKQKKNQSFSDAYFKKNPFSTSYKNLNRIEAKKWKNNHSEKKYIMFFQEQIVGEPLKVSHLNENAEEKKIVNKSGTSLIHLISRNTKKKAIENILKYTLPLDNNFKIEDLIKDIFKLLKPFPYLKKIMEEVWEQQSKEIINHLQPLKKRSSIKYLNDSSDQEAELNSNKKLINKLIFTHFKNKFYKSLYLWFSSEEIQSLLPLLNKRLKEHLEVELSRDVFPFLPCSINVYNGEANNIFISCGKHINGHPCYLGIKDLIDKYPEYFYPGYGYDSDNLENLNYINQIFDDLLLF